MYENEGMNENEYNYNNKWWIKINEQMNHVCMLEWHVKKWTDRNTNSRMKMNVFICKWVLLSCAESNKQKIPKRSYGHLVDKGLWKWI